MYFATVTIQCSKYTVEIQYRRIAIWGGTVAQWVLPQVQRHAV